MRHTCENEEGHLILGDGLLYCENAGKRQCWTVFEDHRAAAESTVPDVPCFSGSTTRKVLPPPTVLST